MDELLARMRAALRHQLQTHGERPVFRTGDLSVDLVRRAYSDYLDRNDLFYDVERELVRASALHVICNMCGDVDIILKDGAIDRRYGDGGDLDPLGTGLNPTRPPSRRRR